jgi:hypothetical protein
MPKFQTMMTLEEIRQHDEACRVAEEERIRQDCDHVGDWVHDHDPNRLGVDAYFCTKCGQRMKTE